MTSLPSFCWMANCTFIRPTTLSASAIAAVWRLSSAIVSAELTALVQALTGTAGDLLLAVWRRVPLDVLTVDGDAERAATMIASVRLE